MNKKVAVVDIDGVLFDVELFKKDYFAIFELEGVSSVIFKSTYDKSKESGYYDVEAHLRFLRQTYRHLDAGVFIERIKALLAKHDAYLFSDAVPFSRFLKDIGYNIFLLSTGTPWFQESKILNSALIAFIDGIIVTTEPLKSVEFSKIYRSNHNASFVLIDDTAAVINALKTIFPSVFAVQILRNWQSSRLALFSDAVAPNLAEARESIARLEN